MAVMSGKGKELFLLQSFSLLSVRELTLERNLYFLQVSFLICKKVVKL